MTDIVKGTGKTKYMKRKSETTKDEIEQERPKRWVLQVVEQNGDNVA